MSDPRPPFPQPPSDPAQPPVPLGPYASWQPPSPQYPLPSQPGAPWTPPGAPQPPSTRADINAYAAPRVKTSVIVAVAVGLILVAVLFAGVFLRGDKPTPAPTPTSGTSTSALPGMPFTMPGDTTSTGRWEVVDREWTDQGVSVHIRVYASSGTVTYGFQAYAKGASDAIRPTRGGRQPELTTGSITNGQVADGYIFLALPHAESTLFLTTRGGRAISALPITA